MLNAVGRTPGLVDVDRIEEHFARRCRACVRIPWYPHLEAGAEAAVGDLQPATRGAYLELAAAIGAGFAEKRVKEALAMITISTLIADAGIGGTPDPNGLPGSAALQSLISGIAFWALLAALGGLLISAAVWALSSHAGNYQHSALGRRGTVVSAVAAFIVGAAPAIINFFENLGTDGALKCPAATSAASPVGSGRSASRSVPVKIAGVLVLVGIGFTVGAGVTSSRVYDCSAARDRDRYEPRSDCARAPCARLPGAHPCKCHRGGGAVDHRIRREGLAGSEPCRGGREADRFRRIESKPPVRV